MMNEISLGKTAFPKAVKATKPRISIKLPGPHVRLDFTIRTYVDMHLLFQHKAYCMSPRSQMRTRRIERGGEPVLAFFIEGQVLNAHGEGHSLLYRGIFRRKS